MQAAVFKGVGLPLAIETRPDPVPEPDEIILRVGRGGICGTDLAMTDGSAPTRRRPDRSGGSYTARGKPRDADGRPRNGYL